MGNNKIIKPEWVPSAYKETGTPEEKVTVPTDKVKPGSNPGKATRQVKSRPVIKSNK